MTPMLTFSQWTILLGSITTGLSIAVVPIIVAFLNNRKKERARASGDSPPVTMGMPSTSDLSMLITQVRDMQIRINELEREVQKFERENELLRRLVQSKTD